MMINYDVAIIGAGPAGLFAAYHILEHCGAATVVLVEKGKAVQDRKCCESCQTCAERDRCSILCGVGGGGLFSDGKLILDLHSGGKLDAITSFVYRIVCPLGPSSTRTTSLLSFNETYGFPQISFAKFVVI